MTDIKTVVGIVVLYKCSLEDSKTISTLNKSLEHIKKRLQILVYDNSTKKSYANEFFEYGNFDIRYKHDPQNPGISRAYNEGIEYASFHGANWILLMDQDTSYSKNFMASYFDVISKELIPEVVCILPKVIASNNNVMLSPLKHFPGGILRAPSDTKPGIVSTNSISGINSGTFVSRQFMESIGGFSEDYPLDMLDHWYFREIGRRKKRVLLLDTVIHHDLSVNSFFQNVSIERYNNILLSEGKFYRNKILDLSIYKVRLMYRIIKQLRTRKGEYVKLTLKYLFR